MHPSAHRIAYYHLPGLFEDYALYARFLPLYRAHPEYFYDWCSIGSIYGAPENCLWSGGRISDGTADVRDVLALLLEYGISGRLTFSNLLLQKDHLSDARCNLLCQLFSEGTESSFTVTAGTETDSSLSVTASEKGKVSKKTATLQNGVIVASDLLTTYLKEHYPSLYLVSSTTKVLTRIDDFRKELACPDFRYVVPDFRLNKSFDMLDALPQEAKQKVEFLCNECCWVGCTERKICYEAVSRIALGLPDPAHHCHAPHAAEGYRLYIVNK